MELKLFIVTMEDMREGWMKGQTLAQVAIMLENTKKPVRAIEEVPETGAELDCPCLYTFLHEYGMAELAESFNRATREREGK